MIKNDVTVTRNSVVTYSKGQTKVIKTTYVKDGSIDESYELIAHNHGNGLLSKQEVTELFDILDAIRETNNYHF